MLVYSNGEPVLEGDLFNQAGSTYCEVTRILPAIGTYKYQVFYIYHGSEGNVEPEDSVRVGHSVSWFLWQRTKPAVRVPRKKSGLAEFIRRTSVSP